MEAMRSKVFLLAVIHQTTTEFEMQRPGLECFYWRLYIKPQLQYRQSLANLSVSIGGYTSNHNFVMLKALWRSSVSIGGYTSNHNFVKLGVERAASVSIGGYTSNHNISHNISSNV